MEVEKVKTPRLETLLLGLGGQAPGRRGGLPSPGPRPRMSPTGFPSERNLEEFLDLDIGSLRPLRSPVTLWPFFLSSRFYQDPEGTHGRYQASLTQHHLLLPPPQAKRLP